MGMWDLVNWDSDVWSGMGSIQWTLFQIYYGAAAQAQEAVWDKPTLVALTGGSLDGTLTYVYKLIAEDAEGHVIVSEPESITLDPSHETVEVTWWMFSDTVTYTLVRYHGEDIVWIEIPAPANWTDPTYTYVDDGTGGEPGPYIPTTDRPDVVNDPPHYGIVGISDCLESGTLQQVIVDDWLEEDTADLTFTIFDVFTDPTTQVEVPNNGDEIVLNLNMPTPNGESLVFGVGGPLIMTTSERAYRIENGRLNVTITAHMVDRQRLELDQVIGTSTPPRAAPLNVQPFDLESDIATHLEDVYGVGWETTLAGAVSRFTGLKFGRVVDFGQGSETSLSTEADSAVSVQGAYRAAGIYHPFANENAVTSYVDPNTTMRAWLRTFIGPITPGSAYWGQSPRLLLTGVGVTASYPSETVGVPAGAFGPNMGSINITSAPDEAPRVHLGIDSLQERKQLPRYDHITLWGLGYVVAAVGGRTWVPPSPIGDAESANPSPLGGKTLHGMIYIVGGALGNARGAGDAAAQQMMKMIDRAANQVEVHHPRWAGSPALGGTMRVQIPGFSGDYTLVSITTNLATGESTWVGGQP